MTKPDRESLLHEGERLLANWGVAPGAVAADLAPLIGRSTAADVAIANRLGACADEANVPLLAQIEQASADKLVHKEVKRARYRLEQRGVAQPVAAPAAAPPATAVLLEGYLSPVDGAGDQLVWLLKPRAGGLLHLFAVINDPEGLREVESNVITRKALKSLREELWAKHEIRLVSADWQYCDFLLHRAFRWGRDRGTPIRGDYPALRAQLVRVPPAEDLPPLAWRHVSPAATADPALLADSGQLFEQPELRTWAFSPEALRPFVDELENLRHSLIVLNEPQNEERSRTVVDRAIATLFAGEQRASYARRLCELAYIFAVTDRSDAARQALAVAQALADPARSPNQISLCDAMVRLSLAAVWQTETAAESERRGTALVVTPQQFMAERERR